MTQACVNKSNVAGTPLQLNASQKENQEALNNPLPRSVDDPTAKQLAKFPASGVLGHSLFQKREK
jgi:hypothetical protein